MTKQHKVFMGAFVASSLLVGWLVSSATRDSGASSSGDGVDAATAKPRNLGGLTPEVRARQAAEALGGRYAVRFAVDLDVQSGDLDGLEGKRHMTLEGELELGASPEGGPWLMGRFQDLLVGGDAALMARTGFEGSSQDTGARLAGAFALRFDARGAVVERRFDPALPTGARNVVGMFAAAMQVVRPTGEVADPDATQWTVEEDGLDGPVEARYEVTSGSVVKVWRREVGASRRTPEEPAHIVSEGRATSIRNGDGALTKASFELSMTGDMSLIEAAPLKLTSATSGELERLEGASMVWASGLDPLKLDTEETIEARAETARAERLPKAPDESAAELVAAAEAAWQAGDHTRRRHAMKQLAAAIKVVPAALPVVTERLRTPGVEGNELRTLVEALSLANTPEAFDTMSDLMEDPATPSLARHSVTVAAGLVDSPPAALIDALLRLSRGPMDEVGAAALLGLGIQGNAQRAGAESARVREDLLGRAQGALSAGGPNTDAQTVAASGGIAAPTAVPTTAGLAADIEPPRISVWLDALGNLGGDDVWPLIAPYMTHPEEWIRDSAVGALYFVTLAEARQALAERLANDPSEHVRRTALRTAANHPQRIFEVAIIRALQEDPAPRVRLEAATALAAWGLDTPALYEVIAVAAEREPDPDVRGVMGELQPVDLTDPQDLEDLEDEALIVPPTAEELDALGRPRVATPALRPTTYVPAVQP